MGVSSRGSRWLQCTAADRTASGRPRQPACAGRAQRKREMACERRAGAAYAPRLAIHATYGAADLNVFPLARLGKTAGARNGSVSFDNKISCGSELFHKKVC